MIMPKEKMFIDLQNQQNKQMNFHFQQGDSHTFSNDLSQHYSIEQETQQLLNEVFNQDYQPIYNPNSTKKKEEQYVKVKKQINQVHKSEFKKNHHKIYQNIDKQALTPSFSQFLSKEQERVQKRNIWLRKERSKKEEKQIKTLKQKPQILRGSRDNLAPIFQRCIGIQKNKQKQMQQKRNDKFHKEVKQANSFSYHPTINSKKSQISFQQYVQQKQQWQKQKEQQISKQRIQLQVKKIQQCTFKPNLVAKYNQPNSRIVPGERVQERLLRSLEQPHNKKNT